MMRCVRRSNVAIEPDNHLTKFGTWFSEDPPFFSIRIARIVVPIRFYINEQMLIDLLVFASNKIKVQTKQVDDFSVLRFVRNIQANYIPLDYALLALRKQIQVVV